MSEDTSWLEDFILPWIHTPGTAKTEREKEKFAPKDNIWRDFHIFDNEWIEIQNRVDWYESPNVPQIYEEHKYIMKQNMDMKRPEETYYQQNVDTDEFKSDMYSTTELPSGNGEVKIETNIWTKSPPSGDNNFCLVEYLVKTYIRYDMPGGIDFLPRFIAWPLNRFFKWAFLKHIGEEMIDRDGEFAREKTTEYTHYIRKYHGEEPIQTRTRQAEFKPSREEGIFFQ